MIRRTIEMALFVAVSMAAGQTQAEGPAKAGKAQPATTQGIFRRTIKNWNPRPIPLGLIRVHG